MYQPYPGSETQLPESRRIPAPASVRNAATVMYAGAAASLIGIVVELLWRRESSAYFRQAPA